MSEKEELEIKGMIGLITRQLIEQENDFRMQDIMRSIHEAGRLTTDPATRERFQQAIRMLAGSMH